LGAEGSVDAKEQWQSAQAFLYSELSKQLRQLWANGNGAAINGHDRAETAIQEPAEPEPAQAPPEHWCAEHAAPFTQKSGKDGQAWHSHKAPDGSWCREAA